MIENQSTNNVLANLQANLDQTNLTIEIKTADILGTDYTSLFRGLSTFEIERIDSYPNNNNNTSNLAEQNTSVPNGTPLLKQDYNQILLKQDMTDLSDLIINQPQNVILNAKNNQEQLQQINNEQQHELFNKENQNNMNSTMNNNYTNIGKIMSEQNGANNEQEKSNNRKRVLEQRQSFSSQGSSENLSISASKKRRGRKPKSLIENGELHQNQLQNIANTNRPLTKREREMQLALGNGKKVVCFGNKVVEKDTDEYVKRREKNKIAVKKCRQKLYQEQQEKERRMRMLEDENKRLNNTVESLSKELNVLLKTI